MIEAALSYDLKNDATIGPLVLGGIHNDRRPQADTASIQLEFRKA